MRWYWTKNTTFVPFDDEISDVLEGCFAEHGHGMKAKVAIGGTDYHVYKRKGAQGGWRQERRDDPSRWRAVSRGEPATVDLLSDSEDDCEDDRSGDDSPNKPLKALHDERVRRQAQTSPMTATQQKPAPFPAQAPPAAPAPAAAPASTAAAKKGTKAKDVRVRDTTDDEFRLLDAINRVKDAAYNTDASEWKELNGQVWIISKKWRTVATGDKAGQRLPKLQVSAHQA